MKIRGIYVGVLAMLVMSMFTSCSDQSKTIDEVSFHYEDLDRFWRAYDFMKDETESKERTRTLQNIYFDNASPGLQKLIAKDKLNAINMQDHMRDTVFYNSIRANINLLPSKENKLRKQMREFAVLYPDAVYNDIYYVIGQFFHAGTVIDETMVIEAQKCTMDNSTRSASLFTEDKESNLVLFKNLNALIIHEQVHVNQSNKKSSSLLGKAITEGGADFITYLQLGEVPGYQKDIYETADNNEYRIWKAFQHDLKLDFKAVQKNWFYNYNMEGTTPDLGYYVGFKICEAYYNKAENKSKAIKYLLNEDNHREILERSGYNGGK